MLYFAVQRSKHWVCVIYNCHFNTLLYGPSLIASSYRLIQRCPKYGMGTKCGPQHYFSCPLGVLLSWHMSIEILLFTNLVKVRLIMQIK